VKERAATALVDGHNAMGQVAAVYAMKIAIEKARQCGSAAVSIKRGNHFGTCAYFAEMAAREDMIGFVWTNGGPVMAPWGGTERQLGNNPFAIALPCKTKRPIVLDMAQSVVARGKIVMAMKTKTPIPDTWALDTEGRPTSDPVAGYWGTVRPAGDYKGSGLSILVSMVSALLPGAAIGPTMVDLYEQLTTPFNAGQLLQVIDISAMSEGEEFKQRMDDYVDYLKSGKKAKGFDEILVPGEPEHIIYEKQIKEGIRYPVEIIKEYRDLCEKLGVEKIV
jgi:LDH2 family malate/lactate/ureidoglycolate dehydrogenase